MKTLLGYISKFLQIIVSILILTFIGCEKEGEIPNRKVIISHMGEIEQDTRFIGDKVQFKIYYKNISSNTANIGIMDQLDQGLDQIKVLNNGNYDHVNHTVIWKFENVSPGSSGAVEFSAVLTEHGTVENFANILIGLKDIQRFKVSNRIDLKRKIDSLQLPKSNVIESNKVTIKVRKKPQLGWIPFEQQYKEGMKPNSNMKDETTQDIMINFNIPGMYATEIKVDEITYHQLFMPMHANTMAIGKPRMPVVGRVIEVPKDVDFTIEIVKKKSINLNYYNIYPSQEPEIREPKQQTPNSFELDSKTYLDKENFPSQLALVKSEDIGIIRGHRVVFLKTYPVQFNPVTKELTAYSQIEVKIIYSKPAQIKPVSFRTKSNAFEAMLQKSILNFKNDARHARTDPPPQKEVGCDYLILTHGDFYNDTANTNPVVRYAAWKQQKGYITRVVDIADIPNGQTADDIRNYIQNAYDKWFPVPTYVLLVGDAEFIPTNYEDYNGNDIPHPYDNIPGVNDYQGANTGTDLYYTTVDGADHFPDIFLGRLSVDNAGEAADVINKILDYEQNPPITPANTDFYTDASLVQLFEDNIEVNPGGIRGNSQEDGTFRIVEFAEEIRTYLQNNAYNAGRIYTRSGNIAAGPLRYEDGTNIPANLTIANGFQWNGAAAGITNNLNAGNFLTIYDGHGNRQSWSGPAYTNNNINLLANGNLTPVVFSLACETGWFDNETDDDATLGIENRNTANNAESFCETFLRHNNGGAVGIIGASRVSYEENDFMMLGMVTAIWPDFDPNPTLSAGQMPEYYNSILRRLGQINTFSKIFMANAYENDQLQFELYHVFGDPEMPIWTEAPATLDVFHPEGIGSTGEQDFLVKVYDNATKLPVRNAQVSFTMNNNLIETSQTNPAGIARFKLNGVSSGDMDITVVASNYRPYMDKIIVSASGAQLNRLDPQDGMEDQLIHVGGINYSGNENIDIYFDGTSLHSVNASAGSFGQSSGTDVDIKVPIPSDLGPVNILAKGSNSNRYGVDVFQVRSANPIDLFTYSQWDNSTWNLYTGNNPVWNNPEIQLYDEATNNAVQSNNLVVGNNYKIKLKVHNNTSFNANNVKVTFKWANFGVGQPERVWQEIDIDELDVPANSVREAEVRWTPGSTGHLCIKAYIYHIEETNENNNSGQENCHVGPTSSPASIPFLVWNPTKKPAMVYLELRQLLGEEKEEEGKVFWGSAIKHPDPQLIPPGEFREAMVIIDPDKAVTKIREGQTAEFSLTGFIDSLMIGGANFIIRKGK